MITSQPIAPELLAQDETLLAHIRAGLQADPAGMPTLPASVAATAATYLLERADCRSIPRATAADVELCERTPGVTELAHLEPNCGRAGCRAAGERRVALPGKRERVLCTRDAARRIRRHLAGGVA